MDESGSDYAGAPPGAWRTVSRYHGLGRILGSALAAGLTLTAFTEGDRVPWKALDRMIRRDRDYWVLPPDVPFVPLSFILQAVKG